MCYNIEMCHPQFPVFSTEIKNLLPIELFNQEKIQTYLNSLNHQDNFLIERRVCELPFNHPFKVLKVSNFNRIHGMNQTVLKLDGNDSKFGDSSDGMSFIIALDEAFSKERNVMALKELVNDSNGYLTVELHSQKKSHSVNIFKFSFHRFEVDCVGGSKKQSVKKQNKRKNKKL